MINNLQKESKRGKNNEGNNFRQGQHGAGNRQEL